MSVQQMVLLASTGGAVVFALVGYVLRGLSGSGAAQPVAGPGDEELAAERRSRSRAEQEAQQARAQLEQREQLLGDVQRRYDELLESVDKQPTEVTQRAQGVPAAELQKIEKEHAAARRELETERKARQQLERQLAEAKRIANSGAKEVATEGEKLRKKLLEETERWNLERNDLKSQASAAKTAQDKAEVQQEELRKELERLRREQKQLRGKAQAEGAAQGDQLKQAEQQIRTLQQQLASAKETREALEEQLRRASDSSDGEISQLRADNARLKEAGESLKAKVAELEFKGEDTASSLRSLDEAQVELRDLKKRLHVAEQKASTADALRDEVVQLRASVEETGKQSAELEELDGLRKKQRELQVKSQMLAQRVEQLQQYADDNVTLRERVRSLEAIGEAHEVLQKRIKDLEALLFAQGAGEKVEQKLAGSERERTGTATFSGTMAATLEGQLQVLSEQDKCRVAVLADSQGLLLGGAGEAQYFEPLAGVAGMIGEAVQRTREFLPLGAARIVEISDANDVSLYARLLKLDSEMLAICTLGQRRGSTDPHVERVADALPRVLAVSS